VAGALRRGRKEYRKKRREYRELCEKKRKEENNRLMKEAREARTQVEVWRVINRKRKRKMEISREIEMEEWDGHFKKLLGGSESRVERGRRGKEGRRGGWRGREGVREGRDREGEEEVEKREGDGK